MNKQTFINGGQATMAGFVNSLYGTEGSSSVAAFVQAHLKPQRPVTAATVGWDYATLVTLMCHYGPPCTQADLDAAIGAWSGT